VRPAVRDRIVQAAAKILLEPVFEADVPPCSFVLRSVCRRSVLSGARPGVAHGLTAARIWGTIRQSVGCYASVERGAMSCCHDACRAFGTRR
jgi:hypothetical protein